jgi:hypothetical protein
MKPQQITYDICRCYLKDRKKFLRETLWKQLDGFCRSRNFQALASCFDVSVHDVTCAEEARTLLQVEAFFKKNNSFLDPLAARLQAVLSFEEGEQMCADTNTSLDSFCAEHVSDFSLEVQRMSSWIDETLGPFSTFLEKIPKIGYVTSGATATRSRRNALPHLRISKRLVCTPGAAPYLESLSEYFGYGKLGCRLVSENRVAFVPKSWKTERTIACEAEGNVFLQLAFDKYAKTRLRRRGVNLYDQTRNQKLAMEGSVNGELATIDLSMASDTLAYNTVCLLLPREWFAYLRSVRSQYYQLYPLKREAYHKFSSMGNGATFALETLVFAAACSAVGASTYSVYGDDIIIDSDKVERLIALLAFLGFSVNTSKSFTRGPFRESCGVSCWNGLDITPRYIRELDDRKAVICHLVNSMMMISSPLGSLQDYLCQLVADFRLPLVPFSEDSMSGVWVDVHTAYLRKIIRTNTRGRFAWIPRVKAYQPQSRNFRVYDSRALFLWYLGTYGRVRSNGEYVSTRYSTFSHKYVRKWVHWKPVAKGAPETLNWFSELLSRHGP